MKEWQLELGPRWDAVRSKGRTLGWHEDGRLFVAALARRHGLKWYETRSQDLVEEFMILDSNGLFNQLCGFGELKCRRLIEIFEAASEGVTLDAPEFGEGSSQDMLFLTSEVLERWGVPRNYPLHLMPLSTRLVNFCEHQQITSLSTLLDVWAAIGWDGLLAHDNIGRRTVQEMQDLAEAIANADAAAARRWLPLNDNETALCLRRALALCHGALTPQEVDILTLRLVNQRTLEDSAMDYGITRERVRQHEAGYLRGIRAILHWFSVEYANMLEAWMGDRDWNYSVLPQATSETTTLILAGIEACFADTPQGVARRLAVETEMNAWMTGIENHPELYLGGVDLQTYLDRDVPASRQADFILELTNKRGLTIDLASGLVKPSSPSVRDTLCAILAQEETPIPLTWLAHRVRGIEGCEESDSDFIMRNRYRWSQLGFLDLSKVIWGQ